MIQNIQAVTDTFMEDDCIEKEELKGKGRGKGKGKGRGKGKGKGKGKNKAMPETILSSSVLDPPLTPPPGLSSPLMPPPPLQEEEIQVDKEFFNTPVCLLQFYPLT
jgi:hypothetical protein